MNKTIIIAALVTMTSLSASAQTDRTSTNTNNSGLTEQDTVHRRARWDNPTTDDPNSMKTRPGVGIQMDNGTRQDQREFKNTTDTIGRRQKLPRR